jgi:hypothetical protein
MRIQKEKYLSFTNASYSLYAGSPVKRCSFVSSFLLYFRPHSTPYT